jgi:hypothetical protein
VLGKTGAFERALFRPDTLPPSAILTIALAPAVVAGLILFRVAAAEMLVLALCIGGIAHLIARLIHQPLTVSPIIPSLVGVALIGPGASTAWALGVATAAAAFELARVRVLPRFRIHSGLLGYSALYLLGRGGPAAYVKPVSNQPFPEPIALWHRFYGAGAAPIEPVTLYVGNVAGPVFATSLLAVLIGAAWLWYARRLSLGVVVALALGACIPIALMGWNFGYQLDSGPLWFVVALAFADRAQVPRAVASRTLMGFAAGVTVLAARARGFGIEAVPLGIVSLQLVVGLVEGSGWLLAERELVRQRSRRIRERAAQIRFVNPLQRSTASSERRETRSA